MSKPILIAEHVDKSFGITHAVNDVSLTIDAGEIRGLIGENGSGKSTFCSMLCGICPIDSGKFILDGIQMHANNQVDANRQGVSIIVQEMGTLSGLTVAENIFLGHEDRFVKYGIKNAAAMNKVAQKLLDEYGFDKIKASMMIDAYNFEDRKLIEIVKATYFNPQVVVVDETTTALSQYGRVKLYKIIDQIRDDGRTVIFISHDLGEVLTHTDTISVLRDGELIDTVKSSDSNENHLKRLMVGRDLGTRYYRTDYGKPVSHEVVLTVCDVSVPNHLQDVSFELRKGEILGFGGLSECGMHEIGKAVFGASHDREGSVTLANGVTINSIPTAINQSIAYASKNRDSESLIINDTILNNIVLPSIDDLTQKGFLSRKKTKTFAKEKCRTAVYQNDWYWSICIRSFRRQQTEGCACTLVG